MHKTRVLLALLCLAVLIISCALPSLAPQRESTASILERLGGIPCPASDFTCVTLSVPLDHTDPENGQTIQVVFAVLPATGERKGMFVTATGGPGSSGLSSADNYASAMDPSILEHFDLVFFDQRGIAASGGLQCSEAAAIYYQASFDTSTPENEAASISAAKTFAENCAAEMNTDLLPYLGTSQAIEDLDMLREAFGDDQIWLYGESYGTQYAQAYAAAHPEQLAGLILDGTVDLTLTGPEFLAEQAAAFDNTLSMTLDACNADPACVDDLGMDAVTAYDTLAAELKATPRPFEYPLTTGGTSARTFSLGDLEYAASSYMYSESARRLFLRALASAVRYGDIVPMARILYESMSLDPDTLAAIPDPTFSDAMYYGVECQDYSYYSGSPEERAEAWMRAGDPLETSMPRFSSIFYGDLPCVFWPSAQTDVPRPAYLTLEDVPTLVLGSTADPATPLSNGRSVYEHLVNGALIVETGGPHVIYGWGLECVDNPVTDFLVDNAMPDSPETFCDGVVARDYYPLSARNAEEFDDVLAAFDAAYIEFYFLPEYYYWDMETPITTSCPFGGAWTFEPSDTGEAYTLEGCAFADGFAMSGTGGFDYDDYSFTLDVTVTGLAEGALTYIQQSDGSAQVTGDYDGQSIDLSEAGQ